MIVTKLQGGMGNQMFQYAAGKALSLQHNTELALDLRSFDNDKKRKYELDVFGIGNSDKIKINKSSIINKIPFIKQLSSNNNFSGYTICKQPSISFDTNFSIYPNDCYLDGYWQSTKYFLEYEKEIRNDFQFNNSILDKYGDLKEILKKVNSIAIHLRRCDYVSGKQTSQVHGTLDVKYYINVLDFISNQVPNSHYFVFSDDHDWAQTNISTIRPITYMDKLNSAAMDMYLMSLCKHQIIANSTFSWWAAWLNKNPDKIVVAPKQWFAIKNLNNQTGDLIPNNWQRL